MTSHGSISSSSSQAYRIVEPHPSVSSKYIHNGRGGAGNVTRTSLQKLTTGVDAQGPPSQIPLKQPSPSSQFTSGRGGAGNVHHQSERAIFSFDEELSAQLRRDSRPSPVFQVTGRGGAGNMVYIDGSTRSSRRKESDSSSSKSSSSAESGADIATRNIRRGLEKGWKKAIGVGNYMTG